MLGNLISNIVYYFDRYSDSLVRIGLFISIAILLYAILQRIFFPNLTRKAIRSFRKIRIENLEHQYSIKEAIDEQKEISLIELSDNGFIRYIQKLLYSTNYKKYDDNSVRKFFTLCATIAIGVYILLGVWMKIFPDGIHSTSDVFRYFNFWLFVGSIASGSCWFFIKVIQLRFRRSDKGSNLYDAIEMFYLKYRGENKNIYFALKSLVKSLQTDIKFSFGHILNGIQTNNDKYVQNAIELFIFEINKSWAKQIAILINRALDGQDIELSLSRLLTDMNEIKKDLFLLYNESADARYLGYAPIVIMPIVMIFNEKQMGSDVWRLMFKYNIGKLTFLACIVICVINLIIALILRKPNHDV